MAKFDDIAKKKLDYISEREEKLSRKVSTAERKLFDVILDKFLAKLEKSEDGTIVFNGKNIELTQVFDEVFDKVHKQLNISLIRKYINDINGITDLNKRYFKVLDGKNKRFSTALNKAQRGTFLRLGIDKDGRIKQDGFLANFIGDTTAQRELKDIVTKGITSGVPFSELKETVKTYVQGNEQVSGKLQSNYRQFIYDTYTQIDRYQNNVIATELKMQSFKYLGGKISTTREFCCQRNGLIFTIEEAKEWSRLRFQGKTKNYDPLVDLGGYNCRHSTQYISNEIAVKRRKDLMIDENGNLVQRPNVPKQQLKKC